MQRTGKAGGRSVNKGRCGRQQQIILTTEINFNVKSILKILDVKSISKNVLNFEIFVVIILSLADSCAFVCTILACW
jgi:hypothetical protein